MVNLVSFTACKSYLSNSLFVLGEFGGNDYNAQIFGGYSPEQASGQSPTVVDGIGKGVEVLHVTDRLITSAACSTASSI